MKATLELSEGTVSANVPVGAWMDAAVSGDIAGVEFGVERVRVVAGQDGPDHYRANPIAMLAMHPTQMMELTLVLLKALGAPAFNQADWLRIADACDLADANDIAAQIRAAYP